MKKLVALSAILMALALSACNALESKEAKAAELTQQVVYIAKTGDVDATADALDELLKFRMDNEDIDIDYQETILKAVNELSDEEAGICMETMASGFGKGISRQRNYLKKAAYIKLALDILEDVDLEKIL